MNTLIIARPMKSSAKHGSLARLSWAVGIALTLHLAWVASAFGAGQAMFNGTGTGEKPQSKLFYHDGTYWAVLDGPSGVAIYEQNGDSWQIGGFMDAILTSSGRADVKWNGTHLFVLVYTSSPKLFKFSYDAPGRAWMLVSGFPVSVPKPSGSETMVLDQDSTGRLWTTAEGGNDINVYYSTSADHTSWSQSPVVLRSGVGSDDISSVVAFGGNKILVFWSDQNRDEFGARVHHDNDSPTNWDAVEIADSGSGHADDHINLAYDSSGRVFALTKDDNDRMRVHRRNTSGSWTTKTDVFGKDGTRGIIMISEATQKAYILQTRWGVSPYRIEYREADYDALNFSNTTNFISSSSSMNNVTGMKQILPGGALLAAAEGGGQTWWNQEGDPGTGGGPEPPTGLTASLLASPDRVQLSWFEPSTGAPSNGYAVYRQVDGGSFQTLASGVGQTSYTDSNPASGMLCYQITAVDGGMASVPSNTACADNTPTFPPNPPQQLVATPVDPAGAGLLRLGFDEGVGQVAADSSGNGNDARLGSTTGSDADDPMWVSGVSATALQFDGTDDYLFVADSPSLDPSGSFTIEAWVQRNSTNVGTLVNKGSSGERTYRVLCTSSDEVEFRWEEANSNRHEVVTGSVLGLFTWHHIACVYDETAGENRVYVDGILQASGPASGTPASNDKQLHIGARLSSSLKDFFDGIIDEFRIVPTALYTQNFTPGSGSGGSEYPTSVQLDWAAATGGDPATGYNVYRSENSGPFLQINTGTVGSTSFLDMDPAPTQICYQVTGVNTGGEGPASNTACADLTPGPPPPGPPQNLTALLQGSDPDSVQLDWQPPTQGEPAVGYHVERQVDGGVFSRLTTTPLTGTQYVDGNLVAGSLCYQVLGIDAQDRDGTPSNTACVQYTPPPPPPPSEPLGFVAAIVQYPGEASGQAAYLFDETSGQSVEDASGNGHTGELGTSPGADSADPTWTTGHVGNALQFDGANDHVRVADAPDLRFPGSFTLEAWVYRDVAGSNQCILSKGDSDVRNFWMRLGSTGVVNFRWETAGGANHGTVSSATVEVGVWTHVVCLYDQTAGQNRIYIDGILVQTDNDSGTPVTSNDPLYIGARLSSGNLKDFHQGRIDLARLSHGALYTGDFTPPTTFGNGDSTTVVELAWTAPAQGTPVGYNVYRKVGQGTLTQINTTLVTETAFVDTDVLADTLCYQVTAVDGQAQEGAQSQEACVVPADGPPPPPPPPPGPPQNLTAALQGSDPDSVQLDWQPPTQGEPAVGYHVERQVDGGAFSRLTTTPIAGTQYLDPNLVPGELCYQVLGVDALDRDGAVSNLACVQYTPPPPPAPSEPLDLVAILAQYPGEAGGQAAYLFDETSGQSVEDASGNGHAGELGTSPGADSADPTWTTGHVGNALQFDGANDHVRVADAPDLRFPGSFTLEAWVYRDAAGSNQCILSKGDSDVRNFWMRLGSTGVVNFRWETAGGANHGTVSSATVEVGVWTHVVCLYDQTAGQNRIYIDGVLVQTDNDSGTPVTSNDPLYIGARLSSGNLKDFYQGRIDLARLSHGALYTGDFTPPTTFGNGDSTTVVEMTWAAPTQGTPVGYNVYRKVGQGTLTQINTALVTETAFVDTDVLADTLCYQVTAVDAQSQEGAQSQEACVVPADGPPPPPPPPPPPSEPLNLTATLNQIPGQAGGAAAYLFDEASGQSIQDASGNGHTGQLGQGPGADTADPTWTTGPIGSALQFDGANDRVVVPDAPDLRFPGSFTLEAWVYRDVTGTGHCILSKGDSDVRNFWMRLGNSGVVDLRWETAGGANHGTKSSDTVSVGVWTHIACLYDQAAGENRIYIDGVLVEVASDSGTPVTSSDPFYIGARLSGGSLKEFHQGRIDLVRVSPGALYTADFTPPTSFGSGDSTTVVDLAWEAPAQGTPVGYNVYRQVGGGTVEQLNTELVTTLAYVDGTSPVGSVCYEVAAVDSVDQEGSHSAPACVTGPPPSKVSLGDPAPEAWRGPRLAIGPNPFNPAASIRFYLPDVRPTRVAIYNVRGQRVALLVQESRGPGLQIVEWDGRTEAGRPATSGTYLFVLHAGDILEKRKLVLLK